VPLLLLEEDDQQTTTGPLRISIAELMSRWPGTVPERIDRTLCNLAKLRSDAGSEFNREDLQLSIGFAGTRAELDYYVEALKEQGFLKVGYADLSSTPMGITPAGWARIGELTHGASSPENPVFVAMWFGDSDEAARAMDDLYNIGLRAGIEKAGYKAARVDKVEHNDWIMDKVLAGIRMARFVVADFTNHRNGVYFEAGFARGLGLPVIHTCRKDCMKDAHFDISQIKSILWEKPEDLCDRVRDRILGTIGPGPFYRKS